MSVCLTRATIQALWKQQGTMKTSGESNNYGLSSAVLKVRANALSGPLANIYNGCLKNGKNPDM